MWPRLWLKLPLTLLGDGLNWFLQTTYSTVLLFLKNQLSSHASAAAYYFLLSIAPLILVIVSILNTSLVNYPELTSELFVFLSQFNEQLNEDFFRRIGILEAQTAVSGLGLLGFLWTSRLIISSMQSAFVVIFPSDRSRNFLWSNLLSLVLVPGVLTLLFVSALFNVAIRFLHSRLEQFDWLEKIYDLLLSLTGLVVPLVLLFGLIFICYRFLPLRRPSTWHAALGAGLCTVAILGLKTAFFHFISMATYNYVYGSLGAVIFLLLWVYLVFLLFFLFAQFVQVAERIDIIALDRIIAPQSKDGGMGERLESILFGRSRRIFSKYARHVPAGQPVFKKGDQDKDVFYLHRGTVEVYPETKDANAAPIASIESGQLFGEMPYLLNEPRASTVMAREDSDLLLIPPRIFERLLTQSPAVSRKIIDSLSMRLKQTTTNDR